MLMVLPFSSMVSLTAPPVLLMRKPMLPPKSNPPPPSATSPDMNPAMPPPRMTNAPSPFFSPWPEIVSETFATAKRVTLMPFA